eukprot:TRINITY_DN13859_c0_g1_i1.p1 TRINITY_DN13859_c0_g1~~TRINITY_DN13859_c0_g1_i1.p1  ORF type:complete len:311 (+),score=43.91 TRINITY_DN13859_c0_g1_i1:55-987(+)
MGCTDSKPKQQKKPAQAAPATAKQQQQKQQQQQQQKQPVVKKVTVVDASPRKPSDNGVEPIYMEPSVTALSDPESVLSPTVATPTHLVPGRWVLYHHPMSQPSRSVAWYLAHLKKDCFLQTVDLLAGEHKSMKYLSLGHVAQVPLLHDGQNYLSESSAILKYITYAHEGDESITSSHLFAGSSPATRAKVNDYLSMHHTNVRAFTTQAFSPVVFSRPEEREAVKKEALERVRPQLKIWDEILKKNPYVAGEELTIGDFLMVPEVDQLQVLGFLDSFPHLDSYVTKMKKIDGYEKTSEGFYGTMKAMGMTA